MAAVSDMGYRWNPYYINHTWDNKDIQDYGRTISDVQNLVDKKKEDIFKNQMQKYRTQVYDKMKTELESTRDEGKFDEAAEILSGEIFNKLDELGSLAKDKQAMWTSGNIEDIEALFADISNFGIRYNKTVKDLNEFETQLNSIIAQYGERNKKKISEDMRTEVVKALLAHQDFQTSTPSGSEAKGKLMTAILSRSSESAFEAVAKESDLDIDIVKMIALVNDLKDPPDYSSTYTVRHRNSKNVEEVSGEGNVKDALVEKFDGWMKHINNILHEAMGIKGLVDVHNDQFRKKLEELGIVLKSDFATYRKHMDITTQVDTSEVDRFIAAMERLGGEVKKFAKTNVRKTDYGITVEGNGASAVLGVTAKASNLEVNAGRHTVNVKLHDTTNALRFLLLQAEFPLKYMTQLYRVLGSRQGNDSPSLDEVFNKFKEWVKYNSLVNAIVGLHNNVDFRSNENIVFMVINQTLFSVWDILNEIYDNIANANVNTLDVDIKFYPDLVRKDYYQMNIKIRGGEKNKQKIIEYMNRRSDKLEAKIASKLMGTKVLVHLRFQDLKALASMVKLRG